MKSRTPRLRALSLIFCMAISSARGNLPANALPTGGNIISGTAQITQSGNRLDITQSTQQGIIQWDSFNIGAQSTVNFAQPNSGSTTLNRVLSSDASQIFGNLNANGSVFLLNPNGVLFGNGAQVDVGGLVASSMQITDDAFLSGEYLFEGDAHSGSVINQGELIGNYIAMLAPEVRNEGVIIAEQGTVALAAGGAVTLNILGNQLIDVEVSEADYDTLVENKHLVEAEEGFAVLTAKSAVSLLGKVVNTGEVSASGVINDGGVIRLVASSTVLHSGEITSDGGDAGDGGSVILLSDLENPDSQKVVSGGISARGGSSSGDGGFIETSASQWESLSQQLSLPRHPLDRQENG
ncbi:MAG: filamentous hemagglutinin N-terminal domain-containing protein [Opitutales bacterium]|nr:filamentous hemagglutinin N-terminal domain-containing protein [Opitutales bacterium]